jgi:DNA polymerase-3 subunit epsilon
MRERQVVLDTETTGLDPGQGHRVIEIGCIELRNRRLTERQFHVYLCPDRAIDVEAVKVHGLDNDFLKDQPRFAEIAEQFLEFVRGAELIIHNAPFDLGFLNRELQRCGRGQSALEQLCTVEDTLLLARQRHPGQRNNLDALCKRYGIDNSQRTLHGALLDAEILADVYLAMTRQQGFAVRSGERGHGAAQAAGEPTGGAVSEPAAAAGDPRQCRGARRSRPVSRYAGQEKRRSLRVAAIG